MDPTAKATEEIHQLRKALRDVIALSTLPASWAGLNLDSVAHSLAELLLTTLPLEFVYVRLNDAVGNKVFELLHNSRPGSHGESVRSAIAAVLKGGSPELPASIPDPFGSGTMRVVSIRFGLKSDGVLVVGSRNEQFPTDGDQTVLKVGANQFAAAAQQRRTSDVTEQRMADQSLRERERELQLVADHAPVFLVHCDVESRYRFVNKSYAERFGLSPQELLGQRIEDVVGKRAYAEIEPHIRDALSGRLVEFEAEIPYERLGVRVMQCTYAPEYGTSGQVEGVVAVITDITQRKLSEEARRESEQRFARFMEYLPGLAWIKDSQGRYVYANDAAVRAFRASRTELYGKTDEDVFPSATAAQFKQNDQLALSSGAGVQVVEALEHEDGTIRYSLVSKFPLQLAEEDASLVGGMAIDITDQRNFEDALRRSETRFRGLMEQAPFSIQILSPEGRTLRVNKAWEELWGLTLSQISDYNVLLDPQLEANGVLPFIRRGFSGEATHVPAVLYDPNETVPQGSRHEDSRRWVSATIYPLKNESGEIQEVVLFHNDITARKRAEDALRDAHRDLEDRVRRRTAELVQANVTRPHGRYQPLT